MFSKALFVLAAVPAALLVAGIQPWKDKTIADWSDDDAHQVLTESPWARSVHTTMEHSSGGQRSSGGMGRGGIGVGGIGIGIPGMGGRGRRGGGYPGGGYPG